MKNLKRIDKASPFFVGFIQAVLVSVYCIVIVLFMWNMGEYLSGGPEFSAMFFMLMLLVFSAALCGFLVFGYPAYLLLNKNLNRALQILGFSALSFLGIFLIALILFIILMK